MRLLLCLAPCLALAGCFEESTTPRDASAFVLVDSLAAFADIQANLTTDPAKAGEALGKFMRAPIAAGALLDQPFDPAVADRVARIGVVPAGIPACLDTMGTTGCDSFMTNAECEAGPFRFSGNASRTCTPCTEVLGQCDYTWDLAIHHTTPDLAIDLQTHTLAPVSIDRSNLVFDATLAFTGTLGEFATTGDVRVCSCGTIALGSDHRPRSSSLVVKDVVATPQRCARLTFDAAGDVEISNDCACTNGGCL